MSLYQDIVLSDRPALFLPMNEASGPFLDITGNGYDANIYGALTRNSTFATVDGLGGAVSTGGYGISPKGNLPFGDNWTVECWIQGTASSSWFSAYNTRSWPFAFSGDLQLPNNYRDVVAHLVLAYNGFSANHVLFAGASSFYNPSSTATDRDDANNTETGGAMNGNNPTSQTTVVSGGNPITIPKYHIVIRRAPGHSTTTNANYLTVWRNGVALTEPGLNISRVFPSKDNGLGLFGKPASASTIAGAPMLSTWMSSVSMYDYCLSDAQVLRHYQAGQTGAVPSSNRVAGSTLLDGIATGGFPVFVHRRDTGALLGKTVSAANGSFSCNVGSYAGLVYAVAFDTVSGTYFPAQVFDLITPST